MEPKRTAFRVSGMDCNNCALGIKRQLDALGLKDVRVNFASAEVSFLPRGAEEISQAAATINSLGYRVLSGAAEQQDRSKTLNFGIGHKFAVSLFFTLPLLLSMFIPWDFLHHPWLQFGLALPVYLLGMWHFGRSAWFSLRSGVPNMDVLITIGSTAAFVYSFIGMLHHLGHNYLFFETSASIFTLIFLGNLLEHKAIRRTTSAIDDLVRLQKSTARILIVKKGIETIHETEAAMVRSGDIVIVNEGEKIPADGIIEWGEGMLDESPVTGESEAVLRSIGETVVGSTVLVRGSLRVKATAVGSDSVLGRIIELVKNAQSDKPRLQHLADKISAVFVPVVTSLALLTFFISWLAADVDLRSAMMCGIAVLVIACPCALGLAIPTAVVVGVGRVSRLGILIRGASTIQRIVSVKHIAFDKTGTLTTGEFSITKTEIFHGTQAEIASAFYALEKHSSHPLALSIIRSFEGSDALELSYAEEIKGVGVRGTDKAGNHWLAGSERILPENYSGDREGVFLMKNGMPVARLIMQDQIRPGAEAVISFFKKRGVIPVMISGDRIEKCQSVADALGIEKVFASQLPSEKLDIIRKLSSGGGVAMVGDGINDAPALAGADIGISLSNATQAAINSAQVVLLKGDLRLLPPTYLISKNTLTIIKQNLFWAFFYNVIAIPIAAAGFLSPMVAAASMALSDVVVVLNSLRLRKKKIS